MSEFVMNSLTNSLLTGHRADTAPLVVFDSDGGMHLDRVTIMPFGDERIIPTLRRQGAASWRRRRWTLHRQARAWWQAQGLIAGRQLG